jgi:hypothetical protein
VEDDRVRTKKRIMCAPASKINVRIIRVMLRFESKIHGICNFYGPLSIVLVACNCTAVDIFLV